MRGASDTIGRGSEDDEIESASEAWDNDCVAAQLNAIAYSINEETAHLDKVVEIVDGWSSALTTVVNKDNILVSWAGRLLVNSAELVHHVHGGWPSGEENYEKIQQMVENVLVPNMYAAARPEDDKPAAGGNQAILGHMAGLEFAIFTNNVTGFNHHLEVLQGPRVCEKYGGSGIQAMIHNGTGQIAEAARDQAHSGMEIGFAEEAAWVAANQGNLQSPQEVGNISRTRANVSCR